MKPDYEELWWNFLGRLKEVRDEYPIEIDEWKLVPFKSYSKETLDWVIQCMEESEKNILSFKEKPPCPNCDYVLDYHEWTLAGEKYKVIACASCGYIKDIK
jgi:CRISPR/Cas system-associated endonuclease/helicase Cas3